MVNGLLYILKTMKHIQRNCKQNQMFTPNNERIPPLIQRKLLETQIKFSDDTKKLNTKMV